MSPLIALVLAAAVPQAGAVDAQPEKGAQATVRATAEILRAETSTPDPGQDGTQRHVRSRPGGQFAVEFE